MISFSHRLQFYLFFKTMRRYQQKLLNDEHVASINDALFDEIQRTLEETLEDNHQRTREEEDQKLLDEVQQRIASRIGAKVSSYFLYEFLVFTDWLGDDYHKVCRRRNRNHSQCFP